MVQGKGHVVGDLLPGLADGAVAQHGHFQPVLQCCVFHCERSSQNSSFENGQGPLGFARSGLCHFYFLGMYRSQRASPSNTLLSFRASPTGLWDFRKGACSKMDTAVVLPSATGAITRLISSSSPADRKDQFITPPPATISFSMPNRLRSFCISRPQSNTSFPANT